MVLSLLCGVISVPAPVATQDAPEWRENRAMIQLVLGSEKMRQTRLFQRKEDATLPLVVPFVPRGTAFTCGKTTWKSVPWLTKRQRSLGRFFEFYGLSRSTDTPGPDRPYVSIEAFYRPGNCSFDASISAAGTGWRLNSLDTGIE